MKYNDNKISAEYLFRYLYVGIVNHTYTNLLSRIENYLFKKKIQEVQFEKDPIFIIGHWRTGTTFLHYLMSKDPQWGFVNNVHAFFPNFVFHNNNRFIGKVVRMHLPRKRPMDNVVIDLEFPQEEEFALGNMTNQSCYHWWTFPNMRKEYFTKYCLMKNLSDEELKTFEETYFFLIKKMSLVNKNKQLLLKNPVNTGRIPILLKMFPNAKFIYLERNPSEVYHSTVKMHMKLSENFSFQKFTKSKIESETIHFFKELIEKYQTDKQLIAKDNLIELKYESMLENPLKTVERVYSEMGLENFSSVKNNFKLFIDSQKSYKKDSYLIDDSFQEKLQWQP